MLIPVLNPNIYAKSRPNKPAAAIGRLSIAPAVLAAAPADWLVEGSLLAAAAVPEDVAVVETAGGVVGSATPEGQCQ